MAAHRSRRVHIASLYAAQLPLKTFWATTTQQRIQRHLAQLHDQSGPKIAWEFGCEVTCHRFSHWTYRIPTQPVDKTYASFSDLWLEIPTLAVSTPIVGVPLSSDGSDVTWLGADAGWLNETAFPSWRVIPVITAHVWDAFNQPGVFNN